MQEDANSRQPPEVWGGVEREIEKTAPKVLIVGTFACRQLIRNQVTSQGLGVLDVSEMLIPHPSSLLSSYWHNWRTVRGDESDYVIRIVSRVLLTKGGAEAPTKFCASQLSQSLQLPNTRYNVGAEFEILPSCVWNIVGGRTFDGFQNNRSLY